MIGWPLLALFLASCVTINIYFPAAAAEEAARTIVRDVLGKEGEAPAQPEQGTPQSSLQQPSAAVVIAGRILEALVPAAQAAGQADIDISSPAIKRLRASMHSRQSQLDGFYRSGAVGFANDGSVQLRDISAVELRDRTQVKKLVADENSDRNALYREIARANGHPEWEDEVRSTFARVWRQEARQGYWVQMPNGSWQRK
jgi:uncharacterized protein YdbL (DUF1318 family)